MLEFEIVEWAEVSDGELVRRIVELRESETEAELCRRLGPRIRLYGLRHLRDEAAASDLSQQVLLTTLEAVRGGRLRDPEKLASFVLGTSRVMVLDMRRGSARRERLLGEYARVIPTEVEPVEPIAKDQLTACLMRLAERERSVILMTFYEERSGESVGASLGMSLANVRVVRHRALERLRTCMEGAA